jgi:imidazole glycerol-phosphate synthase subunit HisH
MNTAISLIDYGAGNLTSVRKGFAAVGVDLTTPREPADLSDVRAIVVPGVGHFQATTPLGGEWRNAILRAVEGGAALFGICLGLQWLFESSTEAEDVRGLGLMRGRCERLPSTVKVPHVGWNSLAPTRPSRLLEGIPDAAQVYFTHSFAAPVTDDCVAATTHGRSFAAAVERGRVCGVQFHPEKSGDVGLQIIRNFLTKIAA